MIDLALRETEISVDLEEEQYPDLQLRMSTLTDAEAARLMAGSVKSFGTEGEDMQIDMPYDEMLELFSSKVVGFEGEEVNIGGEAFDAARPEHIESLRMPWKIRAMSALLSYATKLPEDSAKNSSTQG